MCCLARRISRLPELWGPPSWAVPGKFIGPVGHRKHNCLQEQARSHRSRAWKVSLILDTGFNGIYFYFIFLTKFKTWSLYIYRCQVRPMIAAIALRGSLQDSTFCSYETSCYCYPYSDCLSFIHDEFAFLIDMFGICMSQL